MKALFGSAPEGPYFATIDRYRFTVASLAYFGSVGLLRYAVLTAPFTKSAPARWTAAAITASVDETELITSVSGFQLSAFAVAIARTVGVGVVRSTHVSAPDAFWRAICDP